MIRKFFVVAALCALIGAYHIATVYGSAIVVIAGTVIGADYADDTAPTNGLAVEGSIGVGTLTPANSIDVEGGQGIKVGSATPSSTTAALYNVSGTLYWNGAPVGTSITLEVGTTGITSGTSGYLLYDNSGTLGDIATSGSGNVCLTTSCVMTTPNLGTPSALTLTNATGLPVAGGGTSSTKGALSVFSCTIPDSAAASTNWCDWKAGNTGTVAAFFDDVAVRYQSTCSTTYPIVEVYDVTQSTGVGSTTVPDDSVTVTSVNASASSATATDEYAIRVTTAGSGCSSSLASEFITVTATVRQ